jgi:multidrug resistance efflux pump
MPATLAGKAGLIEQQQRLRVDQLELHASTAQANLRAAKAELAEQNIQLQHAKAQLASTKQSTLHAVQEVSLLTAKGTKSTPTGDTC